MAAYAGWQGVPLLGDWVIVIVDTGMPKSTWVAPRDVFSKDAISWSSLEGFIHAFPISMRMQLPEEHSKTFWNRSEPVGYLEHI